MEVGDGGWWAGVGVGVGVGYQVPKPRVETLRVVYESAPQRELAVKEQHLFDTLPSNCYL